MTTEVTYTILQDGSVRETLPDGHVQFIPADELNADYQTFLAWKEAGNVPASEAA